MKVGLTEAAEADLERIGDFIARDNPKRAENFVRELIAKCDALADAPLGFPLVPRFERFRVRRRAYRTYLIFYRVQTDRIDVLHVLHGAQAYEAILFPSG